MSSVGNFGLPQPPAVTPAYSRATRPGPGGHLHPHAHTRLVRWLLAPAAPVEEILREILLEQVNMAPVTVGAGCGIMLVLSGMYYWITLGNLFLALFAGSLLAGALRLLACAQLLSCPPRQFAAWTDCFVLATLFWALAQGVIAAAAQCSDRPALQVLSAASVFGLAGMLCVNYYPAPRLAMALVSLLTLPFVAAAAHAADHALVAIAVFMPFFILGGLSNARRFQHLAIDILEARLASQRQARHDHLTGALNRLGLMEALDVRGAPANQRLALFYLDLDGFKQVNDRFGHHAGDELLRLVADRLRRVTREGDVFARMGGDEFVIIAPGIAPADGEAFAARLVEAIAREAFVLESGASVRVGVSIGFGCAPEDCGSLQELYRKADAALYRVKETGKGSCLRV